jgi:uncharacterized protein YjiS (DUF1127 family)
MPKEASMARFIASLASTPRPSRLTGAARAVFGSIARLARAIGDRQDVKRLMELDDRALKDIGLTRSDVDGALAEPLFRNPSTALVRSVERRSRADAGVVPAKRSTRPVVPLVKQACCA